jgi:hypothetical protein
MSFSTSIAGKGSCGHAVRTVYQFQTVKHAGQDGTVLWVLGTTNALKSFSVATFFVPLCVEVGSF